jgi:hypothetical protein
MDLTRLLLGIAIAPEIIVGSAVTPPLLSP